MSDNGKQSALSLGNAANTLAEGVKTMPVIAAIVLVLLIVGVVIAIAYAGDRLALLGYGIMALVVVALLGYLALRGPTKDTRGASGHRPTPRDTVALAAHMTPRQLEDLRRAIEGMVLEVAGELNLPMDCIRANVFGVEDGRLKMIEELTYNMNRPQELTVTMEVGQGSNGRAFQSGRANFATFKQDWGDDVLPGSEMAKLHPDLRWVVSVPLVLRPGERPIWVVNVDGLKEERTAEQLSEAFKRMVYYAQFFALGAAELIQSEALKEE